MKSINDLIYEIKNFRNAGNEPEKIKIIVGYDSINKNRQIENYCIESKISIYKVFGEVAFILNDFSFAPSELFILGILFGSIDYAVEFIKQLSSGPELYGNFIDYLYFKHGLVLINWKCNTSKFHILNRYNVESVLLIGNCNSKKIREYFNHRKQARIGSVIHCSPINMGKETDYFSTWFEHSDRSIKKVGECEKCSLKDFIII